MGLVKFLVLEGPPQSTNHIYKIFKTSMYMSPEGKSLKRSYQYQAKLQFKLKAPLTESLELSIKLFFSDKRVRDIDNYNKILLDSLSGIAYVDDKQIQKLTIIKSYDKHKPRIEIRISPFIDASY